MTDRVPSDRDGAGNRADGTDNRADGTDNRADGTDNRADGAKSGGGDAPDSGDAPEALVEVRDLAVHYGGGFGSGESVRAVDGVTLDVRRGETLGLVGESGCGKTTLGRTLLGLEDPTAGTVRYAGRDVADATRRERRRFRQDVQMVFQDPESALDGRMTVGEIVREPLAVHDWPTLAVAVAGRPDASVSGDRVVAFDDAVHRRPDVLIDPGDDGPTATVREAVPLTTADLSVSTTGEGVTVAVGPGADALQRARVRSTLEAVGLEAGHYSRYPHQFSGGQRQRVAIARALAIEPEFVVLDEPVTALDASVQARILNLLADLQAERGLTYLLIAHDLSVVEHVCDRVAVMYLGNLMEVGPVDAVFDDPANPYTHALRSAIPTPDPTASTDRITLRGTPPDPRNPPSGCPFSTRCPMAIQPPAYRDLDREAWDAIEAFRAMVRERADRRHSLAERAAAFLGLATIPADVDDVVDETFADISLPSPVDTHVEHAATLLRQGRAAAARDYLREEFAGPCERESPGMAFLGAPESIAEVESPVADDRERRSRCHRHDDAHESPANYRRSHDLD